MASPKQKQTRMFMHTIDGRAATFSRRNRQIVYVEILPYWKDRPNRVRLCASVEQIEREQARTIAYRKRMGFEDNAGKYGYAIVTVPRG